MSLSAKVRSDSEIIKSPNKEENFANSRTASLRLLAVKKIVKSTKRTRYFYDKSTYLIIHFGNEIIIELWVLDNCIFTSAKHDKEPFPMLERVVMLAHQKTHETELQFGQNFIDLVFVAH